MGPQPKLVLIATFLVTVAAVAACGGHKPAEEPAVPETDASTEPAPPPPPPPAQASLYERLGKKDALAGLVEELLGDVLADKRISKPFDKVRKDKARAAQLSARLVAELCIVAGGGGDCGYDGKNMKDAHAGMNVTQAQWDAFIEDLGIALKTRSVDDALAKELLDKLAAQTHDDIVAPAKTK